MQHCGAVPGDLLALFHGPAVFDNGYQSVVSQVAIGAQDSRPGLHSFCVDSVFDPASTVSFEQRRFTATRRAQRLHQDVAGRWIEFGNAADVVLPGEIEVHRVVEQAVVCMGDGSQVGPGSGHGLEGAVEMVVGGEGDADSFPLLSGPAQPFGIAADFDQGAAHIAA